MKALRAVLALLLVAAACAPLGSAGTAEDPELTDEAGDQDVSGALDDGGVPVLPVVNPDTFDDIDILSAWFQQGRSDCMDTPPFTCHGVTLIVTTTAAWSGGTLNATFTLQKGPTSYANSTAAGQSFYALVQGTTVSGVANATAAVTPIGLELHLPLARLGALGGDVITGLNLTTARTNLGFVTNPTATQDDSTGSDEATASRAYTLQRPAAVASIDVGVAKTGDKTGNTLNLDRRQDLDIQLRVNNLGSEPDTVTIAVSADPPLKQAPTAPAPVTVAQGDVASVTVPVSLDGMAAGTIRVTFTATSSNGATDDAVAVLVLAFPVVEREVKPAGLNFLSPAAESAGLDDTFGSYAELVLLALIVLIVILVIFLMVALAPSTLAGAGDAEAPPLPPGVGAADAAPAGVLSAAATPAAVPAAASPPTTAAVNPPVAAGAGTAGGALKIESVTHTPEAPEEGAEVATEVILRNPGPTRQVRVVLSRDGADTDEKAITLPARATKTVRLAWTAGAGENRVKVRVLPA